MLLLLKDLTTELKRVIHLRTHDFDQHNHIKVFNIINEKRECECTLFNEGDELILSLYGLCNVLGEGVSEGFVFRFDPKSKEEIEEVQTLLHEAFEPYFKKYLTDVILNDYYQELTSRVSAVKTSNLWDIRSRLSKEQVTGLYFFDKYLRTELVIVRRGKSKGKAYYRITRTSLSFVKDVVTLPVDNSLSD
ncbi:hypothetical protein HWC35_gp152 [Vibrio phage USC-1]|uniref:Uncharacterized protein n=1 Tax=Vibrio phage USC-1 TaxID=2592615 RepID=A0A514A2T9_9CAUD|nr:hypothetical protein HWC35_gp152 [Vibrio phage USC-1]QDH47546.1 hypothetical protein [Vibrio phage USC-1]